MQVEILPVSHNECIQCPTEARCDNINCGIPLEQPVRKLWVEFAESLREFAFCRDCYWICKHGAVIVRVVE